MQLPEARELDTRRRLFRLYPEAREMRPPPMIEIAIEGIASALRGRDADFSEVALDWEGISAVQPARLRVRPHHSARRNPHL